MACCTIGGRPDAAEIDAALRSGGGLGTLAKRFALAKPTLGRHRLKCLGLRGGETARDGARRRLGTLSPRSAPAGGERPLATAGEGAKTRVGRNDASKSRARATQEAPPETARETGGGGDDLDDRAPREWPQRPATKEGRVVAIIDLMASNRWERSKTAPILAEQWGMPQSTVEGDASEASRRIKHIVDPDEVKSTVCVALSKGVQYAVRQKDVRGLAAVARTYAEISGALAPKKHEITGKDGVPFGLPPMLAGLSPPPTNAELEHFALTGELPVRGPSGEPN